MTQIKLVASGRTVEILSRLGGIPRDSLDGRHHPCPKCGGTDRFRLIDEDQGAVLCNKCFSSDNGDLIAAIRWMRGIEFVGAAKLLADYLGLAEDLEFSRRRETLNAIEHMATVKRCSGDSLREYGATADGDAVRFPAYGPDRQQCTEYRVWPGREGKHGKGMFAKGKPAGLFFPLGDQGPRFPTPEETWIVCEGVKDAAAYRSLDYLACGLNTDHLAAKFAELFRGANVVLIPDRTADAEAKAKTSAALLSGVAESVKIGTLPLPIGGSRGDDARDVLKQKDGEQLLRRSIESAAPWRPSENGSARRITLEEATRERLKQYERGPIPKVSLGIPKLDRILDGGIAYGSLALIGALTSHGKTTFALQSAHSITGTQLLPILFVSIEMSADALAERTISYASDAPKENWHMLLEKLEQDTKTHFANAAPCHLVEGISSLEDVERELVKGFKDGCRIAIIDYAQLISAGSRDDTNAIMRRASATLKQVAKEYDAVVLCLAQLNKRVESRSPMVPRISDIDYGTKLGHDADVALLLMWPHRVDSKKPPHEYQIFVDKNRNGRSKVAIECKFNPPR